MNKRIAEFLSELADENEALESKLRASQRDYDWITEQRNDLKKKLKEAKLKIRNLTKEVKREALLK